MRRHHPENEWTKRRYLEYPERGKTAFRRKYGPGGGGDRAIRGRRPIIRISAKFRIEQAQVQKSSTRGPIQKPVGDSPRRRVSSRLMAVKTFFEWLAGQSGFRRGLPIRRQYFRPVGQRRAYREGETREPVATIEQIRRKITSDASQHAKLDQRDRALIAFTLLSGARTTQSPPCPEPRRSRKAQRVPGRADVRTKNRKTFTSWFFWLGTTSKRSWSDWINADTNGRVDVGQDDPLFPASKVMLGAERHLRESAGLGRKHWQKRSSHPQDFQGRLRRGGACPMSIHTASATRWWQLGEQICTTPEEFKAWSQNLGHEHVLTTFTSYGAVAGHRQSQIFDQLRARVWISTAPADPNELDAETVAKIMALLTGRAA